MKKMKIEVGYQVAFNKLPDAVWWDVLDIVGSTMTIRESGTNYARQFMDTCYVEQVKEINVSKNTILQSLNWYEEQIRSLERYNASQNTVAMLAVITALCLDQGSRAKEAKIALNNLKEK